jgi:uncharacterized protein with GYD domain
MPLYFLLGTLNENGQKMLLNNPDLVIDALKDCDCEDAQILGKYFVLGRCDYVMLVEADDNESVGRLAIEIGVKAGLHTETLPAMAIGDMSDGDTLIGELGAESTGLTGEEWRLPANEP